MNEASDTKFVTRKWNIVNDKSNVNYDVGNEVMYNTEVLKSNLYDYNDAYVLVRGDIIIKAHNNPSLVAFKNWAPFIKCITKIDGTTTYNAEDLDLVMPLPNLIEYSSDYSDMPGGSWFYSKHEATDFDADIANTNAFKSFWVER